MLRVGLTGGIGSGKTIVARIFETLGIAVYYADDAAKKLMNSDADLKNAITSHFGEKAYEEGELNRTWLASQVFTDKEKLALLNSLTHPATIRDSEAWMKRQTGPYSIKEAALIFESGADKQLDYVIGVSAPEYIRIQRVIKRDGLNATEIRQRISRQMDENLKLERCDFIINNDGDHLLIPQVLDIDEKLRKMSSKAEN